VALNTSSRRRAGNQISTTKHKLSVVEAAIESLKFDPLNPRVHTARQVRQIADSIRTFRFLVPVLVDSRAKIIAGEGRVRAAQLLGITHVPTICLDHLSEAQIRAFVIADNKLTENAEWNEPLLAEQFKTLSDSELDFNVEVTGFEICEIDLMIENLNAAHPFKEDPADALPGLSAKTQVTQSGDLWSLGHHRICCGDARDKRAYVALMNNQRAAAVFIDPPYNIPIDHYVANFGKIQHPEFAMASGELTGPEFELFLRQVFTQLACHSTNGALHFICMDWRHSGELLTAAGQVYAEFKNLCIWIKDVAGQGSLYRSQHELVFVFKSGREPHRNNIQLGQFGRYRTNVWQYRRVNSLASATDEGKLSELHPTIKPTELVADAILDCTARGDIVLDAFLGSGTTVMAAERTGRCCFGMEIEPHYVDTAIRRWQAYTGESAVHSVTGRTFNEIEKGAANDKER
jgi:DNA modification methylase